MTTHMKKTLFFSLSVTGAQQRPWTGLIFWFVLHQGKMN